MKHVLLAFALLGLPHTLLSQATAWDFELEKQRGPKEKEIAITYAIAIVAAGACIGAGIYFGIRSARKDKD